MTPTLNRRSNIHDVPRTDQRVKRLLAAILIQKRRPDALIEILHTVQDLFGYVSLDMMNLVAEELRIPPSRVYGVITFYHFFSLKPKGDHQCLVCTGTACYVRGAEKVLEEIQKGFGIKAGEVTPDNRLGLQTARCLGSCGLAPAVVLDDAILPKVNPSEAADLIRARIKQ